MKRALAFALRDLTRLRNDTVALLFTIVMPVFFYFIFGVAQDYADLPMPGGNMAAYVMIGMAVYAGVMGAVGAAGSIVTEYRSGWGRQLALTPLTTGQLMFANLCNILVRTTLPVLAVFLAGALTNSTIDGHGWPLAFALTVLCAIPFGFYGLLWAQLVPSNSSVAIATSSIVVLGFAGNLFMPLSGALLDISRFTPLYGSQMLARWAVGEGAIIDASAYDVLHEPLWIPLVNITAWTIAIIGISAVLRRRDNNRI